MAVLGIVLLMIGASGMDSDVLFIPSVLTLAGLTLLFYAGRRMAWITKEE